jgi:hypothetical protein
MNTTAHHYSTHTATVTPPTGDTDDRPVAAAVGPTDDDEDGIAFGRRTMLTATAAAVAGAALGSGTASAAPGNGNGGGNTKTDTTTTLDLHDLGGRRVVGDGGYATIQAAWNDATSGDTIYVHSSYDAQAAGEQFPIVLDFRQKEVLLTGGHPSGSVIDASHTSANVVEVIGKGHEDYRNNPLVSNLKLVGGNVGLRIRAAPYASFKDVVVWKAGSHGVLVDSYEANGSTYGTFGVTFRNMIAWNCGGDGFRLSTGANPHSTTFYGSHALLNAGSGVRLRGYATRWHGGTIQNNGAFGLDARSGASQQVEGTYFEGNGTRESAPMDVYVDDSATGFTLHGSYFQGGYFRDFPNGRTTGKWAVVVAGAPNADVRNCSFRNYTDAFLYLRGAEDADVHLASHAGLDDTTPLVHDSCTRLRSDGVVLPTDLSGGAQPGRFVGDLGTHDGTGDTAFGPAMWDGAAWVSTVDGSRL